MRRGFVALVATVLAVPGALASAQPVDPHAAMPERPSVATHAHTVAPGWVEVEAGFEQAWESGRLGDETLPITIKLGLGQRLQLTVSSAATNPAGGPTTTVDDGSLAVKWRIAESVPVAGDIAIMPSVTVPVESDGLASASFLVIASRMIGAMSLDLNIQYTRREGDGSLEPKHESLWAAALGGPLAGRFGWLAELSGSPATAAPASRAATVNVLAGGTFNLNKSFVLDVALTTPVSGPDSSALLFGFVWNVGAIWKGRPAAP